MDWQKRFLEIKGRKMAYVEMGRGDAIVFQHGNPTSSYLWRNIMPKLAGFGRCIAMDLIGMGDSDKLPNSGPDSYTFKEHYEYFEAALSELGVEERVTLVLHDWGSALGFHWAKNHPDALAGICYMEAIIAPMPDWDDFSEDRAAQQGFQALRSAEGDRMVLEHNGFVERVLPASILRTLEPAEMDEYRRPFREPGESRRPTLTWPRQLPIAGEPQELVEIASAYYGFLRHSTVRKLFIRAEPGALLVGNMLAKARALPDQTEVSVAGLHFIQEDSPEEIASAIASWLRDATP